MPIDDQGLVSPPGAGEQPVRLAPGVELGAQVQMGFSDLSRRLANVEAKISGVEALITTTRDTARDTAKDHQHQRELDLQRERRVEALEHRVDDHAKFTRSALMTAVLALAGAVGALVLSYLKTG